MSQEKEHLDQPDEGLEILKKWIAQSEERRSNMAAEYIPVGENNFIESSIFVGKDHVDKRAIMASIHEFIHNSINYGTPYGSILIILAGLNTKKELREYYEPILKRLHYEAELAHEVYATWSSVIRTLHIYPTVTIDELLNYDRSYIGYFKIGEYITKEIPGYFYLKSSILHACIGFCFSSDKIGQKVDLDLRSFNFSGLESLDFPNERLTRLISDFSPEFFRDTVKEYLIERIDTPEYIIIKKDMSNEYVGDLSDYPGTLEEYCKLSTYIYGLLQQYFNKLGTTSYSFDVRYTTPLNWVEQANFLIGDKYFKTSPFNSFGAIDRDILKQFEKETTILNEKLEKCLIELPSHIHSDLKAQILNGDNETNIWAKDWDLLIMARHSLFLEQQFDYYRQGDLEWLKQQKSPIVFLSTRIYLNEEKINLIIPFSSPKEADWFLTPTVVKVMPRCACVFEHIIAEKVFWEIWYEYLCEECENLIFFNDVSLLSFLEQIQSIEIETIKYCTTEMQVYGTICRPLIFHVVEKYQRPYLMIYPSNPMHTELNISYIKRHFPTFVYETDDNYENFLNKNSLGSLVLCVFRQVFSEHSLTPKFYLIKEQI
ncbi:hypothetical protein VB264_21270 [Arcicella aquatica]|uniref:Uncharacterized protein n=1 Tax=Arcicella aquatica TaxID=217141 RepID=A0ABU5QUK1_9BACT|nr:hypothetical protein [Arcicella aquatica]MEA5260344.1 hypothetical protein [Arcicella aquatica]